jgi:dihydrodipicolinate synthase/N-acetylneuraminate lyase
MSSAPTSWQGILPSLPTPFTETDAIDHDALGRIVEFVVESGAVGIVCMGLAGEVEALSSQEREAVLQTVVAAADGRVPVLAGATCENELASKRLAAVAEAGGASGVVLPPPTNIRLNAKELCDFFTGTASTVELPVIVQDALQYLSSAVSPAIVRAAAERAANICAVKLEVGPEGIESWRAELPAGFALFGGSGGLHLLDCVEAGATGVMPASDLTDMLVEVYDAWRSEDKEEAKECFARVLPMLVFEMQSMQHSNRCVKYVLWRRGLPVIPALRGPATPTLDGPSVARLSSATSRARFRRSQREPRGALRSSPGTGRQRGTDHGTDFGEAADQRQRGEAQRIAPCRSRERSRSSREDRSRRRTRSRRSP